MREGHPGGAYLPAPATVDLKESDQDLPVAPPSRQARLGLALLPRVCCALAPHPGHGRHPRHPAAGGSLMS